MTLQVQPLQNPGTISGVTTLSKPPSLSVKKLLAPPSLKMADPIKAQSISVQPLENKQTLQPGVIDATGVKASPYLGTPQEHTISELGWKIKQKVPDYNDLSDEELGQKIKAKFPEYSDFADKPIDTNDKTLRPDYNKDQGLIKNLANFNIGVAKSVGQAVPGLLKLGGKIGNALQGKGFQQEVDPNSLIGKLNQFLAPSTQTQKLGNVVGDIAQFFVPGVGEEKAALFASKASELLNLGSKGQKALSLLIKAGLAGTKDFTIAQTQGQNNKESATIGVLGGLGPLAEAGISAIAPKTSGGLINSLIKPLSKEFRFGKDPGLAVAKEGIVGNTIESLSKNIIEKKKQIGQAVVDGLKQADIVDPRKINLQPLLKPVDDAISVAVQGGPENQALITRLQNIRNGLTKEFKLVDGKMVENGVKDLNLSRTEANVLKKQIGDDTKWTGQAFDGDVNQVRVKLYQNLNDAIDALTPGTKTLNGRYSNLLSAEKSIERTKAIGERQDLFGIKDLGLSSLAGLAGYAKGGGVTGLISALSTEALYKLASSTFVKSRLASQLAKYIPEVGTTIRELSPQIDKAIQQELSRRGESTIIKPADLGQKKINLNSLVKVNNYQNPDFPKYLPQTTDNAINTRKIVESQLEDKYSGFFKGTQLPKSAKNQVTRNLLLKLGNNK